MSIKLIRCSVAIKLYFNRRTKINQIININKLMLNGYKQFYPLDICIDIIEKKFNKNFGDFKYII